MLFYLLSELLQLFSDLRYITPYLPYVLPAVIFIILGAWAKIIILYFLVLIYDMTESPVVKQIWYVYSVLPSLLYFGSHLLGTVNNYTFCLSSFWPIWFFCYELACCCTWFRSCLSLNNYLKIPPRDLPCGWRVTSGSVCGTVWAST